MNPWFFMSYARSDDRAEDGSYVQRFYDDLCHAIADGVEDGGGKVGWLDRDMDPGVEWPAEIAGALTTCRTFVCIMTARFFQRSYCGKEWAVFEKRRDDSFPAPGVKPPLILPVVWRRPFEGEFPDFVRVLQDGFSTKDASREQREAYDTYAKEGLLYVMKRLHSGNYRIMYETLVEQLAKRIVKVAGEFPLAPWQGSRPDFEATVPKFPPPPTSPSGSEAPTKRTGRRASFVFVAGALKEMTDVRAGADHYYGSSDDGLDWKPYREDERVGARFVMREADELDLVPMWLKVTPDLITLIRKAEEEASVAVMIVDPWSIDLPRFDILRNFDRENFENCCCIVAWDLADPETAGRREELTQRIQDLLRRRFMTTKPPYHAEVTDPKQFGPTIRKSLLEINEILSMRRKPLRTIDAVATRTLPSISAVQEPAP